MTKQILEAQARNETPFALMKPLNGIPTLVKILNLADGKQKLVTATGLDLRDNLMLNVSSSSPAMEVKVPVAATIFQRQNQEGQMYFEVFEPGAREEDSSALVPSVQEQVVEEGEILLEQQQPQKQPLQNATEYLEKSLSTSTAEELTTSDGVVQYVRKIDDNTFELIQVKQDPGVAAPKDPDQLLVITNEQGQDNILIQGMVRINHSFIHIKFG